MPDLDRIDDSLGAGWRSAYDLVSGRIASPAEISDKLIKSLAKELRDRSGVPSLEIAYSILGPDDMNSILRSFRVLDALVKDMEGHRHTRIAVEVAKSKLAFWNTINRYPPSKYPLNRFSNDTLNALMEHYFFARVRPRLVADGIFESQKKVLVWQADIEHALESRVAKLADKLAENPCAKKLRVPRRTTLKSTTKELLLDNLLVLGDQRL